MDEWTLTKVFRINNTHLVVANSIENAVELYHAYYLSCGGFTTSKDDSIKSIEMLSGDSLGLQTDAIIKSAKRDV